MRKTPISTSSGPCIESAQERLKRLRAPFEALHQRFQAFQKMLEDTSASSCEDSPGVPVSSLPESDSAAA